MRAKSEILETLANRMSGSDIWKKLTNALLGRELLALGAEIISEAENVKDTMLLQLNPETADTSGLYMLSQMNEIPITNIKPSSVIVEMMPNTKSYAPFELNYSIGNVAFTNVEYTIQGKTISLLNGTHKCYAKSVPVSEGAVEDGSETYFYDGGTSYSGIRLGNAYPDSIVMTDEHGMEIPRYSSEIALSNDIDVMYKVVTYMGGGIYIRFICKDGVSAPTSFKIDWLDHDCKEFDIEDEVVKVDNVDVATVKYTSQGNTDDVEYMRNQLRKEMAKYNGFNTPKSIEQYVKGLPYVLDAKCERSTEGINIYIKPSSYLDLDTYLDFSEVAAHISLNSVLFPNIKVRTGNQIRFGVEISGVDDAKLQNGIKSLLQEKFSYENMTFNSIVNVGSILSEIYAKYGVVPTINMTIQESFVQDKPLSFKPIKNSLKLYGIDESIVAWEENGLLYGMASSSSQIPFYLYKVAGCMGTNFLLMQEGKKIPRPAARALNALDSEDATQYAIYEDDIEYSVSSKNKFYLYDVSTNTIKPFDGCMQNLLYTDTNPDLRYNAWNADNQTFGNLYDMNFLSTNNALVVQIVFKSSGVDNAATNTHTLKYWSENNTSSYTDYLSGLYASYEKNTDYKGKYQVVFFINNPLALKNPNYDSWQAFCSTANGDPSMAGFYTGLRNMTSTGGKLNIKSNWFIYNNKSYYAYDISSDYVYITNGAKNLAVSLNGSFLGMIPYGEDLYVINERYITKIEGFEGLKEKQTIYQTYKDYNTPMIISEIIREFDNQIAFKTASNEIYTATGFEVIDGNKIGFVNLKQCFVDTTVDIDCRLGGCTKDNVTLYKEVATEKEVGYIYYCYDIKNEKTISHSKITNFSGSGNTYDLEPVEYTDEINLATFFGTNDLVKEVTNYKKDLGKLCYKTSSNGSWKEVTNKDDLFFIRMDGSETENNKVILCVDNIGDYSYPIALIREGTGPEWIRVSDGGTWAKNSDSDGGALDADYIAGFYKVALRSMPITSWENEEPVVTVQRNEVGDTLEIITKTKSTLKKTLTYYDESGTQVSTQSSYEIPCPSLYEVVIQSGKGNGTLYSKATSYTANKPVVFAGYDIVSDGTYTPAGGSGSQHYKDAKKLFIKRYYRETGTKTVTSTEYAWTDDSKELVTVGYFDESKNSCINDKGTEVAYIRYYTQNPNVASNSYLVLDENEIKFI